MSQLPLDQAIARFQQNDERLDKFANGDASEGYISSYGASVPSIQKFLALKDTAINVGAESILAQTTAQADLAEASAIAAENSAINAASAVNVFKDQIAAPTGSSFVGFQQSGTGAVARTAQDKMQESVSVKDFGAVGDGVTDIGVALQKAHDALGPDGGTIHIPAASSYYLIDTEASFTKPIQLVGDGWYNTEILTRTNGLTLIAAYSKLDLENIHFTALDAARGTCKFILQQQSSANHGHGTIENVFFDGALYCYHSQSTNAVVINNCQIGNAGASGAAVWLENLINPDIGDSFITNNTIAGDGISILVASTSGINICNNKFNGPPSTYHVLIAVGANPTGNFLIGNNSFEGHTVAGVKLIATSGIITKTLITGNQFSSENVTHVVVSQGAVNTTITGNTFNSTNAANGTGINVEAGSRNTTITGNAFHQILQGVICSENATLGITMSGNRFAADVTNIFAGDDGQNVQPYSSTREISVSRFFSEATGTLSGAYRFQGNGTLEIMVYGLAQGAGWMNYARKVAIFQTTTVNDINAALAQGSPILAVLAVNAGHLELQIAKSAGSSFTGYVEVIARGQISHISKI